MTFHRSNYGSFGASLPADRDGFVSCSPRRVAACTRAIRAGTPLPKWADTGADAQVARADIALAEWRAAS